MSAKDGRIRKNIPLGSNVQIVLKQNQGSERLTKGIVAAVLTNSAKHPHGIKVQLVSGDIGRVKKVLSTKKGGHPKSQAPLQPKTKEILMPWER